MKHKCVPAVTGSTGPVMAGDPSPAPPQSG
jgi:hypothetical protein